MIRKSTTAVVALCTGAALVLSGCGGSSSNDNGSGGTTTSAAASGSVAPSSKPPLDANGLPTTDIVKQAVTATKQLTAAHLKLTVPQAIQGLPVKTVDATVQKTGDVKPGAAPASVEAKGTATVRIKDAYVDTSFVVLDNTLYAMVPPSTKYQPMGHAGDKGVYDPSVVLDNNKGLVHVLDQIGELKVVDREKLGAVDVVKVTGTVSGATLDPLLPNLTEVLQKGGITGNVPVTLWITDKKGDDSSKPLIAQMQINLKDNPITLALSDFDQKITIAKPTS
jgi:lipoprotein LprG